MPLPGLREGLEETITILRLKVLSLLHKSVRSTNAIESGFSMVDKNVKNVKNWKNSAMVQRWFPTVLLDAERRTHRIKGYCSISVLIAEIKRLTIDLEISDAEKIGNIA